MSRRIKDKDTGSMAIGRRVFLFVGLIVPLVFFIWELSSGFSYTELFQILVTLSKLSIILLAVIGIEALAHSRKVAKPFVVAEYIIAGLAWLALLLLGFGLTQDALGVHCIGFFGAQWKCVVGQEVVVAVLLLQPVVEIAYGALSFVGLISQARRYLTTEKKLL